MKYYAMIDGRQKGPFELEELPGAGVRPSTYIWTKGMANWQKAEDNPDVCRLFRNHLYDLMHPEAKAVFSSPEEIEKYRVKEDSTPGQPRSRFDYYLQQSGESLPTLDEIDARENTDIPPMNMIGYAWLVTILFFFPTGIAALVFAYKSKQQWKNGNHILAHGYNRSAKMWTGISFFIGLIFYAAIFAMI